MAEAFIVLIIIMLYSWYDVYTADVHNNAHCYLGSHSNFLSTSKIIAILLEVSSQKDAIDRHMCIHQKKTKKSKQYCTPCVCILPFYYQASAKILL